MLLNPFIGVNSVGSGVTYWFSERFEGTGYQNTWVEAGTGTIDEDYTGTVLEGSQSLRLVASAQTPNVTGSLPSDQAEIWLFFKIRFQTLTGTNRVLFAVRNVETGAIVYAVNFQTSGALAVQAGSASSSATTDTMSVDTTYNVWCHYLKGTGADAVGSVGFSTGTTEITSGTSYKSVSNGNAVTNAHEIRIGSANSTTYEFVIDQILGSITGTIGDNPT